MNQKNIEAFFIEGLSKKIEMHEYLCFKSVIDIPGLVDMLLAYYSELIKRSLFSNDESDDELYLTIELDIDGKTYSMERPAELLAALYTLGNANGFVIDLKCEGTCGCFVVSIENDEQGQIKSETILPNMLWDGSGLFAALSEICEAADFTYKFMGFYPNSGIQTYARIVDGVPETNEMLRDAKEGIIKEDALGYWWTWNVELGIDFDYEKYPEILSNLHNSVKKHLPESEIQYCEDIWEDDPSDLLPGIQWCTNDLNDVQLFLNEINDIINPIKDEIQPWADGLWELRKRFVVASWIWTGTDFRIFSFNI